MSGAPLANSQFNKLINILLSPSGATGSEQRTWSPVPGKMEQFLWHLQSARDFGGGGDAKKGRAEIYKSKVALNFSLLDVVARITTRTMSIAGEMRLEMAT